MKTLTITFALLVSLTISTFGQSTSNQVVVQTTQEDGITLVTWESTKEVNTSYYVIEKSKNDSTFERIASVPAAGSSSLKKSYSYEDLDTFNASTTYRITLVCMDGTQFATTSTTEEPMNIALTDSE